MSASLCPYKCQENKCAYQGLLSSSNNYVYRKIINLMKQIAIKCIVNNKQIGSCIFRIYPESVLIAFTNNLNEIITIANLFYDEPN